MKKKQSKGFGFVCYSTEQEAQRALKEIGKSKTLQGCTKPLYVNIHEPKDQRIQRIVSRGRSKNVTNIPNVGYPQTVYGVVPYMGGIPYRYPTHPNQPKNPNQPQSGEIDSESNPNQQKITVLQNTDELSQARIAIGQDYMELVGKYHPTISGETASKIVSMIVFSNYPDDYLMNLSDEEKKTIIDTAAKNIKKGKF